MMVDEWVGLEFRHLATLQAIVETGSFRQAASQLGYTPSAVSQQIASLERIIGARLILREQGRRSLGPTEAGKSLLVHMHAIEARLGAAKADIDAFAKGEDGALRIGAFESVERRLLPEVMRRLRERSPIIEIDVAETLLDLDLLDSVERGLLDAAFAVLPLPDGPYRARMILEDPWGLVTGREVAHPRSPVTLSELGELPLVCWRSPSALAPALGPLRTAGVEPRIVLRSDYNAVVQGFAAEGLGIGLLPRLAFNACDERTTFTPLDGLIPPRQIAVVWHCDRTESKAIRSFMTVVRHAAADLAKELLAT
jgi:DNA-binding transcriptional LysR family regulator